MRSAVSIPFLFLLLLLQPSTLISQTESDPIITVDSSLVILNASITDRSGMAVSGLGPKLFRVFEDGVEQEIQLFEAEETPFAAVILLDTSGSMESRVSLARSAAIQFLQGLRLGDRVAIFNFDSKIEMVQDFSNSRDMPDRFFDLKARGMTVLNDAVYKAAELLAERPEKRRAVIVLSDGADSMSRKSAENALQTALLAGVTIYTVDMSGPTTGRDRIQNQGVLKNFAEKSGGRFIATPGGIKMRDAFKQIVEELGMQYTVAYQPSNIKKDGKWREIDLRISRPNLVIRTRKGYRVPKAK